MHVVVVGCGRVGSSLALHLTEIGHTVAVVDKRQESFSRLGARFTGQTVTGIGFDRDRLREAGVEGATALAAVTNGDNSNILIARVARETFGIERVVARIYDPRRAAIYQRLGVPTVATVAWATDRVLRRILPEEEPAVDWVDASAKVIMVEREVSASWSGRPVSDLDSSGRWRVVALTRLGVGQVPKEELVLQDGDSVHISVAGEALADLDAVMAFGYSEGGER